MIAGLGLAFAAMLFFGLGDIVYKRAGTAGVQPHHLLMVQSWVFTPFVALYGLITQTLTFVPGTVWGCLTGLFVMIGFYNFAYSLKSGPISVNAPIFRLSFVLTAGLAILLLHEPLTWHKAIGILLALAASWLLLGASTGGTAADTRRPSASSLGRVLIATASIGVGNVTYKFGLQSGASPAALIVAQGIAVVLLSTTLVAAKERRVQPPVIALRYAPVAAIILGTAFIFMVEGLTRSDASVVVPIAQMGFGVTALYGYLFLRERLTPRKGAGLAAAIAAMISLASG